MISTHDRSRLHGCTTALGFLPVFLVAELSCFIRFSYRVAALQIASVNNRSLRRGAVSHSREGVTPRSGKSVYTTEVATRA